MDQLQQYQQQVDVLRSAMQEKLKLRAGPIDTMVKRSKGRLPRAVYRDAQKVAAAEAFAGHPRLCRTLDFPKLDQASARVLRYLNAIDLADERKGRRLALLGSLSLNLIGVAVLLIVVLRWRGYL